MADPVYRMRAHERPENLCPGDIVEIVEGTWISVAEIETVRLDSDAIGFRSASGGRHVIPFDGGRVRLMRPDSVTIHIEPEGVRA